MKTFNIELTEKEFAFIVGGLQNKIEDLKKGYGHAILEPSDDYHNRPPVIKEKYEFARDLGMRLWHIFNQK